MSDWLLILLTLNFAAACLPEKDSQKPKIFWGEPVQGNNYSSVGSILFKQEDRVELVCSSVVYDKNHIISAAHCIEKLLKEKQSEPILDDLYFSNTNKIPKLFANLSESIEIESYQIHPNRLDSPIGTHDVALFKLKSPVHAPVAQLLITTPSDWFWYQNRIHKDYKISGYGLDENGASGTKRVATISTKPSLINPYEIQTKKGPDACQGDSGGPIYHNSKLVGIASRGDSCGNGGIYTLIHPYTCWIEGIIHSTPNTPNLCVTYMDSQQADFEYEYLELALQRLSDSKSSLNASILNIDSINLMHLDIQNIDFINWIFMINPKVKIDLRGNKIDSITPFQKKKWQSRQLNLIGNNITSKPEETGFIPGQWGNWLDLPVYQICLDGDPDDLMNKFSVDSCERLVSKMYKQEELDFADTTISSFEIFEGLVHLKTLVLENSGLNQEAKLPWIPSLKQLFVGQNGLHIDRWRSNQLGFNEVNVHGDLFPSAGELGRALRQSCAENNQRHFFKRVRDQMPRPDLSCITVSDFLHSTKNLDLSYASNLHHVESVRDLQQLESLSLANTSVYDIGSLKNLKSLRLLNLSHLSIDSLQVTERLINLKRLVLTGTTIRVDSGKVIRRLKQRGVDVVIE